MRLTSLAAAVAAALAAPQAASAQSVFFPHAPTANFSLGLNVSRLSTPNAGARVSWDSVTGAAKGDWIAVNCAPSGAYYWCELCGRAHVGRCGRGRPSGMS